MNKKLRELRERVEQLKAEARALLNEGKIEEAEKLRDEIRNLNRQIEILQEVADADLNQRQGRPVTGQNRTAEQLEQEYRAVFLKGLRRRPISEEERSIIEEYRAMHTGAVASDPDGDSSLIVPQDLDTTINELMRSTNDLSQYITSETVRTLTGSRVLEKDSTITPFAEVAELATIPETDNPQFVGVNYALVKRAGILPISNDLLKATDQALLRYVARWIAKKHVVTKNTLIIAALNTMSKQAVADFKGIKKVFNTMLDPAIAQTATWLTNQDGFNWLDEQEDQNGRPLLQMDPTQPTRRLLLGRPVIVVANRFLPSTTGSPAKAPLIVGNLEELAIHFHLGRYELMSTNVGGDAFKRDSTDLRVITYDDVKLWDPSAGVFCELSLS